MRPRAALSWSGGKDCCLALMRAAESYEIVAMVTMFGEDGTRSRSHGLTPAVIRAQAERLSLPVYLERCSWQTYTDQYIALLAQDFIARGGDARFVTVRPPLLDETWLGQKLDLETLTRLQSVGADPCGELGEYHTVVTNCPAFSSPLMLKSGRQVLSNGCYAIDFTVA
jgi:diphthine-ammonia ligase